MRFNRFPSCLWLFLMNGDKFQVQNTTNRYIRNKLKDKRGSDEMFDDWGKLLPKKTISYICDRKSSALQSCSFGPFACAIAYHKRTKIIFAF